MLSERLKEVRKRKKLTQEKLAELVNTTKGTISNYENKYSTPSNEMLKDLANILGVTTDYLLGRSNDPRLTADQDKKLDIEADKLLKKLYKIPEKDRNEIIEQAADYIEFLAQQKNKDKN